MLTLKPTFSISSFTFITVFFSSSSFSVIGVVSFACLRLLIFLLAILIPVCDSSSLGFCQMHTACKLHYQGDNIQPCDALFQILNQSVVSCPLESVLSWPAYRFLRRQLTCSHKVISRLFKDFPHFFFFCIHTIKGFSIVNEAEEDVWNFSAFSMIQQILAIWSLILLSFLNLACTFESSGFKYSWSLANLDSMWNESNCMIVWAFLGIALLWDWNENGPFSVVWPLLSFPYLLIYCVQHLIVIIFQEFKQLS